MEWEIEINVDEFDRILTGQQNFICGTEGCNVGDTLKFKEKRSKGETNTRTFTREIQYIHKGSGDPASIVKEGGVCMGLVPETGTAEEAEDAGAAHLRCLRCGKAYSISWPAMREIGYTRYSYCETCLRKGIQVLNTMENIVGKE